MSLTAPNERGWRRWVNVRSLAARTTLVFASLVIAIWLVLVIWVVLDSLNRGEATLRSEMHDYAHQVMAVAERWPANAPGIAGALAAVVNIENKSSTDEGADTNTRDFLIQAWRGGLPVLPPPPGLTEVPTVYEQLLPVQVDDAERRLYAVSSTGQAVVVALLFKAPYSASITWPSVTIVLLPLVFSLPLLLIPAWLMTRFGLKPLRATTEEVLARVAGGDLAPLELTRYRELNPLLEAMNQLMARLSQQLKRERAFVADVAHELKTPLAALQANIGTALATHDEARRRGALNDLEPGLNRTTHLVQQLLDMARLEVEAVGGRERRFDLAELCREKLSELVRLADAAQVQLKAELPERLMVLADPDPVASILNNLLDNAIKFSPRGGVVVVSLVASGRQDAGQNQNGFILTVADQGAGIAAHDRPHVFNRFYRCSATALSTEGAGLGMAIVKRAVTLLGGTITLGDAASEAGDGGRPGPPGLRVTVRVPA